MFQLVHNRDSESLTDWDSENREGEGNQKILFEEITNEIPKLKEGNRYQGTGSTERVLNKMNPNTPKLRHTIIKMTKLKRILKAAREKSVTQKFMELP